jgi:hypothetical protein
MPVLNGCVLDVQIQPARGTDKSGATGCLSASVCAARLWAMSPKIGHRKLVRAGGPARQSSVPLLTSKWHVC